MAFIYVLLLIVASLLLTQVSANDELHNNLFGLQRGPHQRAATKARRLALVEEGAKFGDKFESHNFKFSGPYPGKGFLEHRHEVIFRPGTAFLGDWSDVVVSATCARGGYLPGRRTHRGSNAAHAPDDTPFLPGEEMKFQDLPSITLTLSVRDADGALVSEFMESIVNTKTLIIDTPYLDASPTCRDVLDVRLGGRNFSPIFRVISAAAGTSNGGAFTNITLHTEPGALMEPFLAASWSSNSTPNWRWALENRSETLADYDHVFFDIAS